MTDSWHVYIVECADGTMYTGITNDLDARIAAHNAGTGARYTAARTPVTLRWSIAVPDRGAATRIENDIKRLPRRIKLAMCATPPSPGSGGRSPPGPRAGGGRRR